MLHAVIMAGGAGTRFWPASRAALPKQLLDLLGGRTMIQATVDRLGNVIEPERVLVVTGAALVEAIAEQLPRLAREAIIGEPCKRDTAPCIGLAAMAISRDDPDATMVVMPADHVIGTDEQFQQAIVQAGALVDASPDSIVTFGIPPTYPAETFGYIQRGKPLPGERQATVYRVGQFREKPSADVAQEYLDSGDYYWNSGIFVWKAKTILDALAQRQSEMFEHLRRITDAMGTADYESVLQREFTAIQGISIDYAVMEHARDVMVIEAPFTWDDLGNWQSLARLRGVDEQGNTLAGRHLGIDTRGSIIRTSDDHLVVTIGVEDLIVVHTPDATLVANRHDEESIRKVVKELQERGWGEYC